MRVLGKGKWAQVDWRRMARIENADQSFSVHCGAFEIILSICISQSDDEDGLDFKAMPTRRSRAGRFAYQSIGGILMPLILNVILFCIINACLTITYASAKEETVKKILVKIPISVNLEQELYQNWTNQAISNLLAIFAKEKSVNQMNQSIFRVNTVTARRKQGFNQCLKSAKNIIAQAKCTAILLDEDARQPRPVQDLQKHPKLRKLQMRKPPPPMVLKPYEDSARFTSGFRIDRPVIKRYRRHATKTVAEYSLIDKTAERSPFGMVGRFLTGITRTLKRKPSPKSWQSSMLDIAEQGERIKFMKEKNNQWKFQQRQDTTVNPRKPLADTEQMESDPVNNNSRQKSDPGNNNSRPVRLFREGIKLAMMMSGANVDGFDERPIRIISPRFMPIAAEKSDKKPIEILSPSIFDLTAGGKDGLIKTMANSHYRDHEEWLNFIVEASDVAESMRKIEQTEQKLFDALPKTTEAPPKIPTEQDKEEMRKIELMERLQKTLTPRQLRDFNTTGYTRMTRRQIRHVYGPKSPYNHTGTMERFLRMSPKEIRAGLEGDIRALAQAEAFKVRQNDAVVLSPSAFGPVILSNRQVLAPSVLSPVIFSPAILSPHVLAGNYLSPYLLSPSILTPYVLHPYILSANALSPFIVSPMVMGPFILTPSVLSPNILSPLVMFPWILSPNALSPLILSPFFLSPSVLSGHYLTAVVLSPFALSPPFLSETAFNIIIASPSWLS